MSNRSYLNTICTATWEYIDKGLLSLAKIKMLSELKPFIDRIAMTEYISSEEIRKIQDRFGEMPSVITWGDYFQSEIAEDHFDKTDSDFRKILETVKFDIIAAIMIFKDKDAAFFEHIDKQYALATQKKESDLSMEDEEFLHLGLLQSYWHSMGLEKSTLQAEDYRWFEQYGIAKAM